MSRRPDGMANESARDEGPTRRSILGASAIPLFVDLGADEVTLACEAWLADHSERERLIRRWQQIETQLFRARDWAERSRKECDLLSAKHEMDKLDARIDALGANNRELLATLPTLVATSSRGIYRKLAVATIQVPRDENEQVHLLITSILRDYRALHGS